MAAKLAAGVAMKEIWRSYQRKASGSYYRSGEITVQLSHWLQPLRRKLAESETHTWPVAATLNAAHAAENAENARKCGESSAGLTAGPMKKLSRRNSAACVAQLGSKSALKSVPQRKPEESGSSSKK